MAATQETRTLPPRPALFSSSVDVRDLFNRQAEAPPSESHIEDDLPEKSAENTPPKKDESTSKAPLFTPPPPTATTCQLITTTLTYSESGVKPWPYTGCVTSLSGWIPNYTVAVVTPTTASPSASNTPPPAPATGTPPPTPLPTSTTAHKSTKTIAIVTSTVFVGVALFAAFIFCFWYKKGRGHRFRKGGSNSSVGPYSNSSTSINAGRGGTWELNSLNRVKAGTNPNMNMGVGMLHRPLIPGNTTIVTAGFEDTRSDWTTGGHRDYGYSRGGVRV